MRAATDGRAFHESRDVIAKPDILGENECAAPPDTPAILEQPRANAFAHCGAAENDGFSDQTVRRKRPFPLSRSASDGRGRTE